MEDKPPFLVPKIIYYIIIAFYFFQISGYLFSTGEKKPLQDEKAKFIGRVNELSTGTYLLYYKGDDSITLLAFSIFQLLQYFYYIYVGVYSYLKERRKEWLDRNRSFFQHINQYLNIFFTFYWWIFYMPFLEINIANLNCNSSSFVFGMRHECTNSYLPIRIVGYYGLFFTLVTGVISIFLFRNNEFDQKDYLRRKFSSIQMLVLLSRAGVIYLYYLNLSQIFALKAVIMNLLVVLLVLDIILNNPFNNRDISKFYGCAMASFSVGIYVITIFNLTNRIQDGEVFYYFILCLVLLSFSLVAVLNYSYEQMIRLDPTNFKEQILYFKRISFCPSVFEKFSKLSSTDNFNYTITLLGLLSKKCQLVMKFKVWQSCFKKCKESNFTIEKNINLILINMTKLWMDKTNYKQIDSYLEEVFHLLESHKRSEEAQFRLFEVLVFHQQNCVNVACYCKQTTFKSAENMIVKEDVLKLIESLFSFALKSKLIQRKQDLFEHVSLKYISYIAKYRNNPVKAYYELKSLMSQHTTKISFYFDCIQNIISTRIEMMIKLHQENKMKEKKDQYAYHQGVIDEDTNQLKLIDFLHSDKIKADIIPIISKFVQTKIKLYEKMRMGYETISIFGNQIIQMSKMAQQVTRQLKAMIGRDLSFNSQTNPSKKTSQNVYILKILSIYEGIVLNRLTESIKYEEQIIELKKRDYLLNQAVINTLNILKGNMLTVIASISKDPGRIMNKNSKRINSFFEYTNQDLILQYVGQLMPTFLSEIHDGLVQNYVKRGYSPLIQSSAFSYGQNNNGFLIPMSISIENIFEYRDDFCIYASLLKIENAKDFIVISPKGQIFGITQQIYNDVFKKAMENKTLKQKKVHLDAFDVVQKISFFLIMPDILQVISKQEEKEDEQEGLNRQNSSSASETISANQNGFIKVPESFVELHTQYKNNQYFVSEKSKGFSMSSLQTTVQPGVDTQDVLSSYQHFYKDNQIEWDKDNLASETKIKYNVVKQRLQYMKDKKKINQDFYIIQINESSVINNEIERFDSLEIHSPKRKKGKQGENASQPNIAQSTRRLSFYDVIKIATRNRNRALTVSPTNVSINNSISSPMNSFMKKRKTENEIDYSSAISLEQGISENKNLLLGISNTNLDNKQHRGILSTSHLTEKNFAIQLHNAQSGDKSISVMAQETEATSFQNYELHSNKNEDSHLFLNKLQSSPYQHSVKASPLRNILGPQANKDQQLINKSDSKELEPKCSIEDVEVKENQKKVKHKKLFRQSSSMVSSHADNSPTPKAEIVNQEQPKMSLWQRIKNKVSTTTVINQSTAMRGTTMFLRQEQFNNEKIEKAVKKPDTVSSNSAIDMEYELDEDFENSSKRRAGTTTIRKNMKSTHEPRTNHQIRSFSQLSSHSSNNQSAVLFSNIAYSFHLPSYFIKLKIFFSLFISTFMMLEVALSLGIVEQYSQLNDELHFNQIVLQDNAEYSIQVLNSINYFAMQVGLVSPMYASSLTNQLYNTSSSYQLDFSQRLQSYLKFSNDLSQLYQTSIFSYSKETHENVSLAQLKFYNYDSVTQVLQNDRYSNLLQIDQFFYLVKNSYSNLQLDKNTLTNIFSDFSNLQKSLNMRSNIFIGIYMLVSSMFVIFFVPLLRSINQYQERILLLISRTTEGECAAESLKLSEFLKYLQHQNEQWVYKHFFMSDQNVSETPKRSVRSTNYSKIQRTPISQQIKDQSFQNYKQIIFFILLSLIGMSFFGIFIWVIKQYSNLTESYLSFFKFSQFTIPSFNSMLIDWSLIISDSSFRKYSSNYPQMDLQTLQNDYQLSQQNISNFLVQFQQELNKLSSTQYSNIQQISSMYTNSLCKYYQSSNLCTSLPQFTVDIYQAGLAEVISNYLQILNSYEILIDDDISDKIKKASLQEYYSSNLFSALILTGYNNTINFIFEIINLNVKSFDQLYDNLKTTNMYYFLIFGVCLIASFIAMGLYLYKASRTKLSNTNFGLTVLPLSRTQEETTIQMLKYIQKL